MVGKRTLHLRDGIIKTLGKRGVDKRKKEWQNKRYLDNPSDEFLIKLPSSGNKSKLLHVQEMLPFYTKRRKEIIIGSLAL